MEHVKKICFKYIVFLVAFVIVVQNSVVTFAADTSVVYGEKDKVIAGGIAHSLVIKEDGSLWAWGSNDDGQLGDGTNENRKTPVKIMEKVNGISAGGNHSLAIKVDGSLWAWGSNQNGELGDGTRENKAVPVKVMEDVRDVAAGMAFNLAIKKDGSLWVWGSNKNGELGNGTKESENTPVKIMDGAKVIASGLAHNLVIKQDGSLWTWGGNLDGELGNGKKENSYTPVKIMNGVKEIAAGWGYSLAVKNDGSLWAWGSNVTGELGIGTKGNRLTPVKVMDGVKYIATGALHSLAIKNDDSLWAWGDNLYGLLGDGTEENKSKPVKIMNGVSDVAAGAQHSLAIKKDGSLWTWGLNKDGQLGSGTKDFKSAPKNIMDGMPVKNQIIRIILVGKELPCPVAPINENGTIFVPLRLIGAKIGAKVAENIKKKEVTVTFNGTISKLVIGKNTATVNGHSSKLQAAPKIISGYAMVPLSSIRDIFGCKAEYDDSNYVITISIKTTIEEKIAIRHIESAPLGEGPRLVASQDILKIKLTTYKEKDDLIRIIGNPLSTSPVSCNDFSFKVSDLVGKEVPKTKYYESVDNLATTYFALQLDKVPKEGTILDGKFDRVSYINLNNPVLKFINEQQGILGDIGTYFKQSWDNYAGKTDHIYSYEQLKRIALYKKVIQEIVISKDAQQMVGSEVLNNSIAVLSPLNELASTYVGKKVKDSGKEVKEGLLNRFGTALNVLDWANFTVGEVITIFTVKEYNEKLTQSFTSLANASKDPAFVEAVNQVYKDIEAANSKMISEWEKPNIKEAVAKLNSRLVDTGVNAYISYLSGMAGIAYGVFNTAISVSGIGDNLENKEEIEVLGKIQGIANDVIYQTASRIVKDYGNKKSNILDIELLNKAMDIYFMSAETAWNKYIEVLNQEIAIVKDEVKTVYDSEVTRSRNNLQLVNTNIQIFNKGFGSLYYDHIK